MQVDQPTNNRGSFSPLVHPHRPQAENGFAAVKELRDFSQPFFREIAEACNTPRCPAGYDVEKGFIVFGVVIDERRILAVLSENQVGDPVQ